MTRRKLDFAEFFFSLSPLPLSLSRPLPRLTWATATAVFFLPKVWTLCCGFFVAKRGFRRERASNIKGENGTATKGR